MLWIITLIIAVAYFHALQVTPKKKHFVYCLEHSFVHKFTKKKHQLISEVPISMSLNTLAAGCCI